MALQEKFGKAFADTIEIGTVVFDTYRVEDVLGSGTFGAVYKVTDIFSKRQAAVKVSNKKALSSMLYMEYKLYRMMATDSELCMATVPKVFKFGTVHGHPAMLMECLGPSLQEIFELCKLQFRLTTTLLLAMQMINRVAYFHQSTGHVHRDIKPNNFVLGFGTSRNVLYLIDYGLAQPYWDSSVDQHVQYGRKVTQIVGTLRYASRHTHTGHRQSRRDDMESIGYTLVYLTRGSLPWQGIRGANAAQRREQVTEKKLSITAEELCAGLPYAFLSYLLYCRALEFSIEPDYNSMYGMFQLLYRQQGPARRDSLDWSPPDVITERSKPKKPERALTE